MVEEVEAVPDRRRASRPTGRASPTTRSRYSKNSLKNNAYPSSDPKERTKRIAFISLSFLSSTISMLATCVRQSLSLQESSCRLGFMRIIFPVKTTSHRQWKSPLKDVSTALSPGPRLGQPKLLYCCPTLSFSMWLQIRQAHTYKSKKRERQQKFFF